MKQALGRDFVLSLCCLCPDERYEKGEIAMFNILDFIDSKDIREYNRDTLFTPIEQAFLIYHSRRTTVGEKMKAWYELLDTYGEDDFKLTHFGKMKLGEKSNRQILADTVTIYENALAMQNINDGVVFEAAYYKYDFIESVQRVYFSDYSAALDYLKEERQYHEKYGECLDSKELQWGSTVAEIRVKTFGKNAWHDTVFYFDDNFQMVTIEPNRELFVSGWCSVGHLFVYVPLPFKKGDIVRVNTMNEVKYGVLHETPDEAYYTYLLNYNPKYATLETVEILLDLFDPDDGENGCFDRENYNPLEFEKCPEDDLPEGQLNLQLLREVYLGELSAGQMLFWYSNFGKDAHNRY